MIKLKLSPTMIISVAVGAVLIVSIARAVTSGPPTLSREKDISSAQRELLALAVEERVEVL